MSKSTCSYADCNKDKEKEGDIYCDECKEVLYCSVDCQKADLPSHRISCQRINDDRLLNEFNPFNAMYLVALSCFMNNYSLEDFRGTRITLNNNLLSQTDYENDLWENSSIQLMHKEGLPHMIKELERKGLTLDSIDSSSFLFIILYNGCARVFACPIENIEEIMNQMKEFTHGNEGK